MRIFIVAMIGFAIQAIGLVTFITTAKSSWAATTKPVVIGTTVLALAVLLLFANNQYRFLRSVAISALLALGYLVAYHTLGILFFPALLMDLQIPSIEHMRAVMPIFGLLFVLYLMGSFAASMFDKFILSRRIRSR